MSEQDTDPAAVTTAEILATAEPGTDLDTAAAEPGHVVDESGHDAAEPFDEELPTVDPGASGLAEPQRVDGVVRIECPRCHTVWQGNDLRPHAAWFCAQCQFPLFWVNAGIRAGESTTDAAIARFPGTAGRTALSAIDCPTCGEPNPPDPTANCLRCGNPLTLPEAAPPPPQPMQIVVSAPVVQPRRRIWPWIVATGSLALIALILLILLLND